MEQRDAYPSELKDRFILRLPEGMRDRVADLAKANGRSMNAEFVARLQTGLDGAPPSRAEGAEELAESRAQTITAMEFLQGSLCETVEAMFVRLPAKDQRDRALVHARRLAASLLAGAQPGDYLLSRTELLTANPALARFLDDIEADIEAHRKKELRTVGRAGVVKP